MTNIRANASGGVHPENLLQAIQRSTVFDHPVDKFEVLETHISVILLTGLYAYKFKKPVNLGFLDFSTLEKRKYFCEEEVRLNSRTAPELYVGVVRFTGNEKSPMIEGELPVLEYAVKMHQFPERSELNYILDDNKLRSNHIDVLAQKVAEFHRSAAVIPGNHPSGTVQSIEEQSLANLTCIEPAVLEVEQVHRNIDFLRDWTLRKLKQFNSQFRLRKQDGYVRDCHGDLHLRNIVLVNNDIQLIDCIEFSDEIRQIDVISDIAFLLMDLEVRNEDGLAWRFLNKYLQITGDYSGLLLLRFYKIYRALTRAKVECIRLQQAGLSRDQQTEQWLELYNNINQAWDYTIQQQPALIITHGLSGSGKSSICQKITEKLGAISICSDVERKRIHNLPVDAQTDSRPGEGIYSISSSTQTYAHLATLANVIIEAGYSVIVDATFLQKQQRSLFRQLAADRQIPFIIIDLEANKSVLQSRIKERSESKANVSEAGLDVLEYQTRVAEPLDQEELPEQLQIDTECTDEITPVVARIKKKLSM